MACREFAQPIDVTWPVLKELLRERGYDPKQVRGRFRLDRATSDVAYEDWDTEALLLKQGRSLFGKGADAPGMVYEEWDGAGFRARADALGPEASRLCLRIGAMSAEERELASALLDELRP